MQCILIHDAGPPHPDVDRADLRVPQRNPGKISTTTFRKLVAKAVPRPPNLQGGVRDVKTRQGSCRTPENLECRREDMADMYSNLYSAAHSVTGTVRPPPRELNPFLDKVALPDTPSARCDWAGQDILGYSGIHSGIHLWVASGNTFRRSWSPTWRIRRASSVPPSTAAHIPLPWYYWAILGLSGKLCTHRGGCTRVRSIGFLLLIHPSLMSPLNPRGVPPQPAREEKKEKKHALVEEGYLIYR